MKRVISPSVDKLQDDLHDVSLYLSCRIRKYFRLTLSMLGNMFSRWNIEIYFPDNRFWQETGDNSHEMSKHVFGENSLSSDGSVERMANVKRSLVFTYTPKTTFHIAWLFWFFEAYFFLFFIFFNYKRFPDSLEKRAFSHKFCLVAADHFDRRHKCGRICFYCSR